MIRQDSLTKYRNGGLTGYRDLPTVQLGQPLACIVARDTLAVFIQPSTSDTNPNLP